MNSFLEQVCTHIKIEIFIPEEYVKQLNEELSRIDVGHIGNYDHCMSVSTVRGFWRRIRFKEKQESSAKE